MDFLPLQFTVRQRDGQGVTAITDSGHEFRLSHKAVPNENEFKLGDLQADLIDEIERPQLAHAILNEIIGVTPPKLITAHAKKGE
ncbi:MAG: hypothetical protein V1738_04465 [Patescibacteria group bacterium]